MLAVRQRCITYNVICQECCTRTQSAQKNVRICGKIQSSGQKNDISNKQPCNKLSECSHVRPQHNPFHVARYMRSFELFSLACFERDLSLEQHLCHGLVSAFFRPTLSHSATESVSLCFRPRKRWPVLFVFSLPLKPLKLTCPASWKGYIYIYKSPIALQLIKDKLPHTRG